MEAQHDAAVAELQEQSLALKVKDTELVAARQSVRSAVAKALVGAPSG